MAFTVENIVVGMVFDNVKFEKAAKKTMQTLSKFNSTLRSIKSTNALTNIASDIKKITFQPAIKESEKFVTSLNNGGKSVINNVTNVTTKVTSIVESTVNNLTKKVTSSVEGLFKKFDIATISQGSEKFSEMTTAVKTMVAAGYDINKVYETMEKLNWYSDETSYSFSDMANSMSKMASQGIEIEKAYQAVVGISNATALAGQDATASARVAYNLVQSMGTGSLKLIDWRSVQNANVSTVAFKQSIIDAAKALGTLDAEGYALDSTGKRIGKVAVTAQAFEQTLSDGWATTDVLLKSLGEFAGYSDKVRDYVNDYYDLHGEVITAAEAMEHLDAESGKAGESLKNLGRESFRAAQQSKTLKDSISATIDAVSTSWMNVFQSMIGKVDEATKVFTNLTEYMWDIFAEPISSFSEKIDEFSKTRWIDPSNNKVITGRMILIETLYDLLDNVVEILHTVRNTFKNVFGEVSVKSIAKLLQKFNSFVKTIRLTTKVVNENGETITKLTKRGEKLRDIFKFIGIILRTGIKIVKDFFKALSPISDAFKDIFNRSTDVAASLGAVSGKAISLKNPFQKLNEKIKTFSEIIGNAVTKISKFLLPAFTAIKKYGLAGVFVSAQKAGGIFAETIEEIASKLFKIDIKPLINGIKPFANKLLTVVLNVINKIKKNIRPIINFVKNVVSIIFGIISAVLPYVIMIAAKVASIVMSAIGLIIKGIQLLIPVIQRIASVLAPIVGKLLVTLVDILPRIGNILSKAFTLALGLIDKILTRLNAKIGATKSVLDAIFDALDALLPVIAMYAEFKFTRFMVLAQIFAILIDTVATILPTVIDILHEFGTAINEALFPSHSLDELIVGVVYMLAQQIKKLAQNETLINGIKTAIHGAANALAFFVTKMKELLSDPERIEVIKKIFIAIGNLLKNAISLIGTLLLKFVEYSPQIYAFFANIAKYAKEFVAIGYQCVVGLVKGFQNGFRVASGKIGAIFQKVTELVRNVFGVHSPSKVFEGIGGNIIQGLFKGVQNAFKTFKGKVMPLFEKLIKDVKAVFGIHSPSKVFFAIGGFIIAGLVAGIVSGNPKMQEAIGKVLSSVFNLITNIVSTILYAITTIANVLNAGASIILKIFEYLNGSGYLEKLTETISKFFISFFDFVSEFVATIGPTFINVLSAIAKNVESVLNFIASIDFSKVASGVKSFIESGFDKIGKLIKEVYDIIKDNPAELSTFITSLGKSLLYLGTAIALINVSKSLKNLSTSVSTLGSVVTNVVNNLKNKEKTFRPAKLIAMFLSLSMVFFALASLFKVAKSVPIKQTITIFAGLTAVLAIVSALAIIIAKIKVPKDSGSGAIVKAVGGIVAALALLSIGVSGILKAANKFTDPDKLQQTFLSIISLISVLFAGVALIVGLIKLKSQSVQGASQTIETGLKSIADLFKAIGTSFDLISVGIAGLAIIDFNKVTTILNTITKFIASLFIEIGALIAVMSLFSLISKKDVSTSLNGVALMLLNIGLMLDKIAVAIGALAIISFLDISKAVKAITTLLITIFASIAALVVVLNTTSAQTKKVNLGANDPGKVLTGIGNILSSIATAISLIIPSIIALSALNPKALIKGVSSISVLFSLMIAGVVGVLKSLGKMSSVADPGKVIFKTATSFMVIAAAISSLTIPIMSLSTLDGPKLIGTILGISFLFTLMAQAMLSILSSSERLGATENGVLKAAISVAIIASSISELVGIIMILSKFIDSAGKNTGNILLSFMAITTLISSITAAIYFITKSATGSNETAFKTIIGVFSALTVFVFGILGMVIAMHDKINAFDFMAIVGTITLMVVGIAIAIKEILSNVNKTSTVANKTSTAVNKTSTTTKKVQKVVEKDKTNIADIYKTIMSIGATVTGIMLSVSLMAAVINKVGGKKVIGALGIMAGVFAAISVFVTVLAVASKYLLTTEKSVQRLDGIAEIIKKILIPVLISLAALTAIAYALTKFEFPYGSFITILVGFSSIVAGLAAVGIFMKKFQADVTDIYYLMPSVLAAVSSILLLGGIAILLKDVGWDAIGKTAVIYAMVSTMIAGLAAVGIFMKKFQADVTDVYYLMPSLMAALGAIMSLGLLSILMENYVTEDGIKSTIKICLTVGVLISAIAAIGMILSKSESALNAIDKVKTSIFRPLTEMIKAIGLLMIEMAVAEFIFNSVKPGSVIKMVLSLVAILAGLSVLSKELLSFEGISDKAVKNLMTTLGALSGMIALLATVSLIFNASKFGSFSKTMLSLVAALGSLKILTPIFKEYESISLSSIGKISAVLLMLSAVSALLASVSAGFNTVKLGSFVMLLSAMATLLAVARLMATVSKSFENINVESIAKAISGMVSIAASMLILSIAIKNLQGIDWSTFGMMAASLGVLILATTLLGAVGTFAGPGLLMMSAGLMALSLSVMVLGLAINMIGTGLTTFANGILALSTIAPTVGPVLTEVFDGLGMAAESAGEALKKWESVILSAVTSIVRIIVKSIASGLTEAWNTVISMLAAIPEKKEELDLAMEGLKTLIVSVVTMISDTISTLAPTITQALTTLINSILTMVQNTAPQLVSTITQLVELLLDLAIQLTPKFVQVIGNLIQELLSWLLANIAGIGQKIIDIILELIGVLIKNIGPIITKLVEFIIAAIDAIIKNLKPLVDKLLDLIEEVLKEVVHIVDKVVGYAVDCVAGILDAILDHIIDLTTAINKFISGLLVAIVTAIPNLIMTIMEDLGNALKEIGEEMPNHADTLCEGIKSFVSGLGETLGKVVGTLGQAGDMFTSAFEAGLKAVNPENKKLQNPLKQIGKWLLKGLWNGFTEGFTDLWNDIKDFGKKVKDKFKEIFKIKSPSRVMKDEIGMNLGLGIGEGLSGAWNKVKGSVKNFGSKCISKFKDIFDINSPSKITTKFGEFMAEGFSVGIVKEQRNVLKTVDEFASKVIDETKEEFDIHSPSEIFKKLGEFLMKGFNNGLSKEGGKTTSTMDNVWTKLKNSVTKFVGSSKAGSIVDKVKGFFNQFTSGFNLDSMFNAGNLSNGMGLDTIGNMFDSNSFSIDGLTNMFETGLDFSDSIGDTSGLWEQVLGDIEEDNTVVLDVEADTTGLEDSIAQVQKVSSSLTLTTSNRLAAAAKEMVARNMEYSRRRNDVSTDTLNKILGNMETAPEFTNTFNIQSTDPKAVAQEVSDIIQRQIERKSASWA